VTKKIAAEQPFLCWFIAKKIDTLLTAHLGTRSRRKHPLLAWIAESLVTQGGKALGHENE